MKYTIVTRHFDAFLKACVNILTGPLGVVEMNDQLRKILINITNPSTGNPIVEDNIFETAELAGQQVKLIYDSTNFTVEHKRKLEKDLFDQLSAEYNPENITISSTSTNSKKVEQESCSSRPAASKNPFNKQKIPGIKKIIAISSGKGGVGKSTVSVNTALALKNLGYSVGILDTDIYGPSIPLLLNVKHGNPEVTKEEKIIPLKAYDMPFISFGLFTNDEDPVIWRGPMLGGVINQFFFDVEWGELDYLILDLPPGTGDVPLSIVQKTFVDGVVVVSTPQEVALQDSRKGLNMFKKLETPIIGMVENMSYFVCDSCNKKHEIFGRGGVQKEAKKLAVDFLGEIPLDPRITDESNDCPYMQNNENKNTVAWNAYTEIAKKISLKEQV